MGFLGGEMGLEKTYKTHKKELHDVVSSELKQVGKRKTIPSGIMKLCRKISALFSLHGEGGSEHSGDLKFDHSKFGNI